MIKWILSAVAIALLCTDAYSYDREEMRALIHGAEAKMYIRGVDIEGISVSNAVVLGNFHMNDGKGNPFKGITDMNGVYPARGKTTGTWHFYIKKQGWYDTMQDLSYAVPDRLPLKNGRWQPYGITNSVILKRKANPIAMYVKANSAVIKPPAKNEIVGFDLELCDWVAPYGKGASPDILMKYEYEPGAERPWLYYKSAVHFSFTNRFDGVYLAKKDMFSYFKSTYNANTNANYRQSLSFVYDRLNGTIVENSELPKTDYLILRVRSKVDSDGNLISANYAKIYGPIAASKGGIHMGYYYFNPVPNDPNIEADPSKNLMDMYQLGFPP